MTGPVPVVPQRELTLLVDEILRWNRQMNLVTRVDTADRLDALIESCLRGWSLVGGALAGTPGFAETVYVDLGSGAGLPGLVWALARRAAGHDGAVYLVEPRAKRAWFLRRAVRLLELPGATVIEDRWGEAATFVGGPRWRGALLSLKALRLTDREVLEGLANLVGAGGCPEGVWIARFLPVDRSEASAQPGATTLHEDSGEDTLESRVILGDAAPRLELVKYRSAAGGEGQAPSGDERSVR